MVNTMIVRTIRNWPIRILEGDMSEDSHVGQTQPVFRLEAVATSVNGGKRLQRSDARSQPGTKAIPTGSDQNSDCVIDICVNDVYMEYQKWRIKRLLKHPSS